MLSSDPPAKRMQQVLRNGFLEMKIAMMLGKKSGNSCRI
jgi:hypothetical protein